MSSIYDIRSSIRRKRPYFTKKGQIFRRRIIRTDIPDTQNLENQQAYVLYALYNNIYKPMTFLPYFNTASLDKVRLFVDPDTLFTQFKPGILQPSPDNPLHLVPIYPNFHVENISFPPLPSQPILIFFGILAYNPLTRYFIFNHNLICLPTNSKKPDPIHIITELLVPYPRYRDDDADSIWEWDQDKMAIPYVYQLSFPFGTDFSKITGFDLKFSFPTHSYPYLMGFSGSYQSIRPPGKDYYLFSTFSPINFELIPPSDYPSLTSLFKNFTAPPPVDLETLYPPSEE